MICPSEKSQVRAGVDGFVEALLAVPGSRVHRGQELIRSRDPFLLSRVEILLAQQKGLKSQLAAAQARDRVQTSVIREELAIVKANLERVQEQAAELIIPSPRDGVFVVPHAQDITNRFVCKVDVMPAEWDSEPYEARVRREVPGGTNQLPTATLVSTGGGRFAVDPRDPQGRTTLERVFEAELRERIDALRRRLYSKGFRDGLVTESFALVRIRQPAAGHAPPRRSALRRSCHAQRHDARRIDRQLFGRGGRQGDPDSFQSMLSLEDGLFKNAYGDYPMRFFKHWFEPEKSLPGWIGAPIVKSAQSIAEYHYSRTRRDTFCMAATGSV